MPHTAVTTQEDLLKAFDLYSDGIFRHCYLRTRSRDIAKELVVEAFARAWKFVSDGNMVDSLQLCLYRMSHQLIEEQEKGELGSIIQDAFEQLDEHNRFAALSKLPREDRPAVILHYIDGFSVTDVASILGGLPEAHFAAVNRASALLTK